MTPKELKRLSRSDLLEMMLELSKENEALRAENERLHKQVNDRNIAIETCGSLAEAALQLNGIFQAAEAACIQYTENIQARSAGLEAHCQQMETQTRERCEKMEREAREASEVLLAQARSRAQALLERANQRLDGQNQNDGLLAELLGDGETK